MLRYAQSANYLQIKKHFLNVLWKNIEVTIIKTFTLISKNKGKLQELATMFRQLMLPRTFRFTSDILMGFIFFFLGLLY